jgi:poly-gamma-glutamate synthase PgsB/CapB
MMIRSDCSRGGETATRELIVFILGLAVLLAHLMIERVRLGRSLRKIHLRIGVTGSRGKSGITRLVAAGLRDQGRKVLAKTTGARPVLVFPDGTEREILRAGSPSIREQIRIVNLASKIGADTLVSELMSIGEECLAAESGKIIRPGILALTNVRLDHLDEMGRDKKEIARTLSAAFPAGGTVFVPREEVYPVFEERAARLRTRLVPVEATRREKDVLAVLEECREEAAGAPQVFRREFEPNLRLALEILTSLGFGRGEAVEGMGKASPDFGSLRIWRKRFKDPPRDAYFVSAFAANDPESSSAVMDKLGDILPLVSRSLLGLLCLREDRGDRTLQWIRAAEEGFFDGFERVAILGRPARPALLKLRRRLGIKSGKFIRPSGRPPEAAVAGLIVNAEREAVVVGLGNIVGTGERIIHHWEEAGVPYVS